ncbi:MAG: hypothetical protein HHJ15_07625 [Rhodoferax sp.]|uniref:hypothetical protein n=1 Tax=Rhodoferax sp. TaxID=50421 RepID=UPI0017935C0A|nr:hypothetical protein [Rhodoferax sp.]NMM19796.1 hypothetical protein [Rhodoferax sp.]
MFAINYKELSWWYWFVTVCLLTTGVAGYTAGFLWAIGITAFQLVHFAIRKRSITAFPVQVRFWYLVLLLIALPVPMQIIYWVPTIGTWAQEIFGYCAMARLVSLFPWNRSEPLSLALVMKTFFSRPVRGSIKQDPATMGR